MNTINLQGSPRVKHQIVGTMRPKAVLKGYLRMPTLTKLEQRKILNTTENGSYEVLPDENRTLSSVSVNVDVPIPEGYIDPEGTAIIASNGVHDITHYEFAEVNIPERKEEQEATVEITENGTTEILPDGDKVLSKATVNVNVPIPDGYIKPEGSMPITENGTFDVTEKAEVNVQVVAKPEKPYIDSSKMKQFRYLFYQETEENENYKNLDTSSGTHFDYMHNGNIWLTKQPDYDLSNALSLAQMYTNCSLEGEVNIYAPKATIFAYVASGLQQKYTSITLYTEAEADFQMPTMNVKTCSTFKLLGGGRTKGANKLFNDLYGAYVNVELDFTLCVSESLARHSKLTLQSAKNVINALENHAGTDKAFTQSIVFHNDTKALLEADGNTAPDGGTWLQYAQNKGWNT